MLRVVAFGILTVLCAPTSVLAQTVAPSPSASPLPADALPADALPFGRMMGAGSVSGIVWSRCRGADGQPGRWVAVDSAEIVHPTYMIDRFALLRTAPAFSQRNGFYECIGADGSPGTPDPAVPATSTLPVGTKLLWESGVTIRRAGDTDQDALEATFPRGGRAFTDAVGPVVVSDNRITVFSRVYSIDATRYSRKVSIFRPGSHPPAPPTSCMVVVHGPSGHERPVSTLSKPCTALTNEETTGAISEARATMNG